ncbi:hypothetical protein LINPERHAP2_LOCUS4781 [Linum perenne]
MASLVWRSPAECKALKLRQRSSSLTWSAQYEPFLMACRLREGVGTITLEDMEVLTGLPTRVLLVIAAPNRRNTSDICQQWFGVAPPARPISGMTVRVSWVKGLFDRLPDKAPPEVVTFHARAFT